MAYLNSVQLIGNVGNDPDIRVYNDTKFATFKVATTKRFLDRSGEQREQTQWHTCSASGNIAEVVEKYIRKGASVFVSGELTYRQWQDKDGNDRYSTSSTPSRCSTRDRRVPPKSFPRTRTFPISSVKSSKLHKK